MNQIEIWKPVVGYEGLYEVSDCGRLKRVAAARGTKIGHVLNPSKDNKGYFRTRLTDEHGRSKSFRVHRLVAEAFHQNQNKCREVNHKDTNKQNNSASNLEWCTGIQNIQHAAENGLMKGCWKGKFGGDHNKSVDVKATNIDTGEQRTIKGINEAARIFKTNAAAIWRVINGEYKHTKRWRFEYE